MKTLHQTYKVDKTRIGFIKFIFEAYEGLAVATTLDPREGIIRLAISPGQEKDVYRVVKDLAKEFEFHAL